MCPVLVRTYEALPEVFPVWVLKLNTMVTGPSYLFLSVVYTCLTVGGGHLVQIECV